MKKFLQKKLRDQKGMTLIELLAVIVIIAIIAAIAIPAIGNIIENSRVNALKADGQNALAAANIYFTENAGDNQVLISELQTEGYLDDVGNLNTTATDLVDKVTGGNQITAVAALPTGTTQVEFVAATNSDINGAGTAASTGGKVNITR